MATLADDSVATRPAVRDYRADQGFFLKASAALAIVVSFAFVQWAARGYVDPWTAPWWLHAHGLSMVAWLGLLVIQNGLAQIGRIGLHRRLGTIAVALVPIILVLGVLTGYNGVALGRVPPFWSNSFLLALAIVQVAAFGGLVFAALLLRRNTEWHRRLMLGATIVILKAALDRLLPAPLLGAALAPAEGLIQLAAVAVLARHDRAVLMRVHPATWWIAGTVVASHVAMAALAVFPPFTALVDRIAG